MNRLDPILEQMSRSRANLFAATDAISPRTWRSAPRPEAWSVAQVIAHLTMVESAVTRGAERMIQQVPPRLPFWKKLHVPVRMAEWRLVRRKSPIPLDPALLSDKEAMLACVREARARTLSFLDQNRDHDFGAYRRAHPFLGSLNLYDWLRFLAYHEVRHTKQIREIVDALQN